MVCFHKGSTPIPAQSLFMRSSSLGLPLLFLPSTLRASALFVNHTPSNLSTCQQPTLTGSSPVSPKNPRSHQPPHSAPPFLAYLIFSRQQFFSPSYFRKLSLLVLSHRHLKAKHNHPFIAHSTTAPPISSNVTSPSTVTLLSSS